ncbi:hypothetical protein VPT02_045 [Vibrio phage VPT02]|nr:hypothetical protein VPT02_045 [Vibrio phage VPT02]
MNWRQGAGKICKGICYTGICMYFAVVASIVLYYTNIPALFMATVFLLAVAFWGMIDKLERNTKLIYAEMEKQRILQSIQDDLALNNISKDIKTVLVDQMYEKPVVTIEGLQFKTWYVNKMRGITIGERVWRI